MNNNKLVDFLKSVYNKAYLFIGVQVFAFIIIFFILNHETGGGFFSRVFTFLFCVLVGGGLAVYWAKKSEGNPIISFRRGAGTMLTIVTLLLWANNGYVAPAPKDSSTSESFTCPHCDGNGERYNSMRNTYGACSSCGGDGRVSSEQYGRLSK